MPIRRALRKVGLTRMASRTQMSPGEQCDAFSSINGGAAVQTDIVAVTSVDIRCIVAGDAEVGDAIGLCIEADGSQSPIVVNGVIHWKELRRTGFEVGIYVADGVPTQLMAISTEPRRKMSRYRCRVLGTVSAGTRNADIAATVVNYSFDGMGN